MADRKKDERATGAGAEAAEGIRGINEKRSDDRPGSEPLEHREEEHKSGYGGEKSEPKNSSDQR